LAINLTAAGCARPCRFEQKGFKLVGMKMVQAKEDLLKEHYKDLVSKPFFPSLLSYMTSGPVVPMIWEGDGVVKAGRVILGATKPSESAPGTVRGDYAIDVGRNVCHGSDAVETAVREIGLWFRESRLFSLILGVYSFAVSFWGEGGSSRMLSVGLRVHIAHSNLTHYCVDPFSLSLFLSPLTYPSPSLWFKSLTKISCDRAAEKATEWESHSESWIYE